jgi:hypothetical protein
MFIRCIKFNIKQQRKRVGDLYKVWSKYNKWCSQWRTGHCLVPRPRHLAN